MWRTLGLATVAAALIIGAAAQPAAAAPCDAPITNPVACENTKAGNPASEWDVSGAGDSSIQGFATDISVDQGQTVSFKVNTSASAYHLDIYRMGYYGGQGARKVATVQPLAVLPQLQPGCLSNATGLVDCGNWNVSATWSVPADAVSGIYFAKLVRDAGGAGSSHVTFVVRDDDGRADVLFQTSDTTWQAYNQYGGNSLYTGSPAGRAYKVSYNRPITTRGTGAEDFVFNAEYPMVRFLERNGYNLSYSTGIDSDRRGAELLEHKTFLSVGHDEYWSGAQRGNVEAARAAGVHLAFFSGNEVFWKTRLEPSIDGSGTPNRTLVTYKETHDNAKTDPLANVWTGTWRDPRFSPPADGGRPENALTGQIFTVNAGATSAIRVPAADGKMRFWRNTPIASQAAGATTTLPTGTLGYEWDSDLDNGARPAGAFQLSSATVSGAPVLQDYGSTYGTGTATHNMTMYKAASGARVFGAGTVQWSWGLDARHDRGSAAANTSMQQATVNLLADMGSQPSTLMSGLTAATPTADAAAPSSTITAPAANSTIAPGSQVTVTGTATDSGGGAVGGVEVSTNGGTTWRPASGRGTWTYTWAAGSSGTFNLRSRAADDSGNVETPSAGVTVTVGGGSQSCPCSIWPSTATPAVASENDTAALEVGVKFRADVNGRVTGLRFYKGSGNTGTHVGHLWTRTGMLLATATFTGESATGWQQVNLSSPVDITANTTYVASYHAPNGRYAVNEDFFAPTGVDSPPLHALRNGVDGGNGLYAYGPSGTFPTGVYRTENYWVDVVFDTGSGGGGDTTPPTVPNTSPSAGATGVGINANVSATFNEPMNAASITTTTFQLRAPGGAVVPATVSYDAATATATLDPGAALANSTVYTATVSGGASGVKDSAGNALAADKTWTFTTAAPSGTGCPCSIWAPSATPEKPAETSDNAALEVGVKFRAETDGRITGLRFYKGATNTGTHVGHLWSRTGTLLATATFTNESASGWQQVTLSDPVAITAGTTYVASYHAPRGNYAVSEDFFEAGAVNNPPLRALGNGEDGGNGLYGYGPSGTFPTGVFRTENYWVDVVFDSSTAPDTTAPRVTGVLPLDGAQGVPPASNVNAAFSEPMAAASVTTSTVQLRDPAGNLVPASVSYDAGSLSAILDPVGELADSTTYTAKVQGGTGGVEDRAGNKLAADRTWTFTTAAPPGPPPDEGAGGPILVIGKASNPFTRYYAEILRAEGLTQFTVKDISTVTAATLASYDVAILGDMALTAAQVTMLSGWVTGGGDLVAMHPDKQLAGLLGLNDAGATLSNAYLKVDTTAAPGRGIVNQTMQFHGAADRYALNGATSVADLYSTATAATTAPAVTMRSVGSQGGQAAAFTFDLAKSVVQTRQGNPAWAGRERDGTAPIRSDDMFFGAASGDVQPNWVDLSKVAVPQADEQQRLLVNLLGTLTADKKPMPRFWYLPRGLKAAVIMTGDDHANGGTAGRFDQFKAASPAGCSVAQWECIRGTSYLYPNAPLTNAQAVAYDNDGFEVALHLSTGCSDYTPASLESDFTEQLMDFAGRYPGVPPSKTERTHCITFSDWASTPKVELGKGIRLDTNYYYWPASWVANVPGVFTGSGMPMRFADTDGSLIDVYQSTTQMTDESGQVFPFTIDTLLDRALGSTGYYGAFNANMHTDQATSTGANAIVASAKARGVPVVTSRQMLTWLDGRNGSTFDAISWADGRLNFRVGVGAGATGLRAMLPASFGGNALKTLTRDGNAVTLTRETIKGVDYAFFPASAGQYAATYEADTTAPAISSVAATSATDGTATITWTTDEAADSRVDYGTAAGSLTQNATDASAVTAHSIKLTGLTPGTTYFYRVRSADGSGNATTAPDPPATFKTYLAQTPAAAVVETGTLRTGPFSRLAVSDNTLYEVNSTTTNPRTTSWYGSFTGVTVGSGNLKVTYEGRNSRSCTQTLAAWRWSDSTWQQFDSRTVTTSDVTIDVAPTGAATSYISATGEVRVRVRCTGPTANFFASGDFMRIVYQRP